MDRRGFLVISIAGVVDVARGAEAQQVRAVARLGILSPETPPPGLLETVRDELQQRGHVEGQTLRIDVRTAEGNHERLPAIAAEVVALNPDVILAINTSAALAAKRSTSTVPIVITRVADPVKSGLVPSLARPGGNITGVSFTPDVIAVKGLELLKEALPRLARVGALWYADNPGATIVVSEMERASLQLSLTVNRLPIRRPTDLPPAFETAARHRAEAIVVVDDAFVTRHRREVVSAALKQSLPVLSEYRPFVEVGGLMAYGPSTVAMYRRAAHYVDRILRGAQPRDLPIEQPTKFDLFVNLATARRLGITLPQSLLVRADEVVQ
jgi:putative ABC transport system substrate-binding protein